MSIAGLNTLFNDDLNSGIMRLCYDFSSWDDSDDFDYGSPSFIPCRASPSVPNAALTNEAVLWAFDNSNNRSATAETLGENGGLGVKLFGGVSGHNQFVQIVDSTGLYSGQAFTMMFEVEKLARRDFYLSGDGSIHSREILFSNLTGEAPNASGWELGLNTANHLYIRAYDAQSPFCLTFNGITYGKNIWFLTYENKNLSLSWFDPANQKVAKVSRTLTSDLTNGGNWYIGSGIMGGQSLNTGDAGSKVSSLMMNGFAFFDRKFWDSSLTSMAIAWKSDPSTGSSVSQEVSSDISGISESCDDITGVLYVGWNLSGITYETGYVTGDVPEYVEYSGVVDVGDDYFVREGDVFITETNYEEVPITGITGYDFTYPVTEIVTETPVFVYGDVTGIIDQQCVLTYVSSGVTGYVTGLSLGVEGYDPSGLFPDSSSFMGRRFDADESFIELLTGNSSYSGAYQKINLSPIVYESSYGRTKTLFLNSPVFVINGSGEFFLNGLAQRFGTGSSTTSGQTTILELEKDYAVIHNQREAVCSLPFSSSSEILSLWGVMDAGVSGTLSEPNDRPDNGYYSGDWGVFYHYSGGFYSSDGIANLLFEFVPPARLALSISGNSPTVYSNDTFEEWPTGWEGGTWYERGSEFTITGTGQYSEAPLYDISWSGRQIFFNGQKIYSGLMYEIEDGGFVPLGHLTSCTGIYFSLPELDGSVYATGSGIDGYYDGKFWPKSNVLFQNGARIGYDSVIEHCSSKDLLTGMGVEIDGMGIVGSGTVEG